MADAAKHRSLDAPELRAAYEEAGLPFPSQSTNAGERDARLKTAARDVVKRTAKLGAAYLKADPQATSPQLMRESSAAVRDLPLLFDALARSMEYEPEAKYKYGFLLRLIEAVLDVAQVTGVEPVRKILSEKGTLGGLTSGGVRRAKRDQKWAKEALEIGKQFRTKKQHSSQSEVARKIKSELNGRAPEHREILENIRTWEKSGLLPKRSK